MVIVVGEFSDIIFERSFVITKDTNVLLAFDLRDRRRQAFVVTNGLLTLFGVNGEPTVIANKNAGVGVGIGGVQRIQFNLFATETITLDEGFHLGFVAVALDDGQSRIDPFSVRVREVA